MQRKAPDHTEGGRCECIGALRDRDDEGDHPRDVLVDELDLRNECGNDVELPKPMPNKAIPSHSSGMLEPAAAMKAMEPVICTAQLAQATSRVSVPSGKIQPTSVRPTIAKAVASPIAMPACCAPSTGARSENRWATKPIYANSPKAMPAASVRNSTSLQSSERGRSFAVARVTRTARARGGPSGAKPMGWGVRENSFRARPHITAAMAEPISAVAIGNPRRSIAAGQSGEKMTPPILPPL